MCEDEDNIKALTPWVGPILHAIGMALVAAVCILAVLALGGCNTRWLKINPPPVDANCDALCYTACIGADGDTGIRWTGDPSRSTTLDALDNEVIPALKAKLQTCEESRKACVMCLNNLETQKVIKQ